jgi:hypothetical protein
MKTLITLISFFPILSYSQILESSISFKRLISDTSWNITLDSNLGICEINLPKHLDSAFSWAEYSDCGDPCAKIDYRIQPKSYPLFNDNGFYYFPLQDSVEQFTIKHPKIIYGFQVYDSSKQTMQRLTETIKSRYYDNPTNEYLLDTVIKAGNSKISIVAFAGYDKKNKSYVEILKAMTVFKGTDFSLYFEKRNKKRDKKSNFIELSLKCLKSLRLYDRS